MTVDLVKEHKDEYTMPRIPALVTVRAGRYLTATGSGAPGSAGFQTALGGLYGCAYTIKFARKQAGREDFRIAPLEGLWSATGGVNVFTTPKRDWRWKLLIRVPTFVRPEELRAARAALRAKGRAATGIRLETIAEGLAVQMLHVGAYGDEPRTMALMDAFVRSNHLRPRGRHHEIYLSDPRRVPPSRLRTILRCPVGSRSAARSDPSRELS